MIKNSLLSYLKLNNVTPFIKCVLIVLIWNSYSNAFSQINTSPWKIDVSTVNDLKKYGADRQLTIKESRDSREIKIAQEIRSSHTSSILEVFVDTTNGGENWIYSHWGYAKLCSNVRTFWLDCAVIGDIQMKNMYLYFFKDTLYSITLNNPDMVVLDELKKKNSGWKVHEKNEIAYCGKMKASDTLYNHSIITTWNKAGTKVKTEFVKEDGYDIESCEKKLYTEFTIKNGSIDKYVQKCDWSNNQAWSAAQKK